MLNLPNIFESSSNILIAGIGGGFDCFGCIPLYEALTKMGKNCRISSYTLRTMGTYFLERCSNLGKWENGYDPEGMLWEAGYPVIEIHKCTAKPLKGLYQDIIKKYGIDHIVMVDGGVDSLMRGDEVRKGTVAEEFVNFAALQDIPIKKTLVNVGFGCEREEEISHYRVLENIANLVKHGYFLGTCALTPQSEEFQKYKQAYSILEKYPKHKKSHIHPRIIAAVEGDFGEYTVAGNTIMKENKFVLISPLMNILWFFDGDGVISQNCILPTLKDHNVFLETIMTLRNAPQERDNRVIPY